MNICNNEDCVNATSLRPDRAGQYHTKCPSCIQLYKRYKITAPQKKKMHEANDNRCEICYNKFDVSEIAVDHCHKKGSKTKGTVRGLLCHPCNTALGLFYDDVESLTSAIRYLLRDKECNGGEL